MKNIIISLALLVLTCSCATQTFLVNPSVKREVPSGNPHYSKWNNFFISGVGQSSFQNASDLCKESGGISFVETKQSVGQVLVSIATYGIYTPRTMNIYCTNKD